MLDGLELERVQRFLRCSGLWNRAGAPSRSTTLTRPRCRFMLCGASCPSSRRTLFYSLVRLPTHCHRLVTILIILKYWSFMRAWYCIHFRIHVLTRHLTGTVRFNLDPFGEYDEHGALISPTLPRYPCSYPPSDRLITHLSSLTSLTTAFQWFNYPPQRAVLALNQAFRWLVAACPAYFFLSLPICLLLFSVFDKSVALNLFFKHLFFILCRAVDRQ